MPAHNPEYIALIKVLIDDGKTNIEIGEMLGKSSSAINLIAGRYFGGNPNYMKMKTKHKHLRKSVMIYFLTHTWEETQKHFKLTRSELKSVFTVAYKMPEFNHIRKDNMRNHEKWTGKQLQFMIQRVGFIPRKSIGIALGRGKERVIKEKMQKLGINSKTIQGMTLSTYRKNFNQEPSVYIQTKAGPLGGIGMHTHFKIVPWIILEKELDGNYIECPDIVKTYIRTMSIFQNWIFEWNVLGKVKKILKED